MQANPVLNRLTRGSWWVSDAATHRVLALSVFWFCVIALTALIFDPHRRGDLALVPAALLVLGGVIAATNPLIILTVTAMVTTHESRREDFDQLKLAGIKPQQIAEAYIHAAQYRLRYLWAFSLGFAPAAVLALTHMLYATGSSASCVALPQCVSGSPLGWLVFGLIVSVLVVAMAIGVTLPMYSVAMLAGAWIGVKWPHRTPLITGGVVIVGIGLAILAALGVYNRPVWGWVALCGAPVIVPVVCQFFSAIFAHQLDAAINQRTTEGLQ